MQEQFAAARRGRLPDLFGRSMLARMKRPSANWLWLVPPFLFGMAYLDRVESGPVGDWRSASRAPVGLAPDPNATPEPVVQVYAARAVRWRGYFGVHTWVAVKPRDAAEFTVYEVNGWRLRRTGSAVSVDDRAPDSRWFGNRPELLADLRGEGVDEVITRIEAGRRVVSVRGHLSRLARPELEHVRCARAACRARAARRSAGDGDRQGLPRARVRRVVAERHGRAGQPVRRRRRARRRRGGHRAQRARAHVRRRSSRSRR